MQEAERRRRRKTDLLTYLVRPTIPSTLLRDFMYRVGQKDPKLLVNYSRTKLSPPLCGARKSRRVAREKNCHSRDQSKSTQTSTIITERSAYQQRNYLSHGGLKILYICIYEYSCNYA